MSDSSNSLEAPSLVLVTGGLGLLWVQGGHNELTRGLLGLGLILMYLAQGLRVFSLSPRLGPREPPPGFRRLPSPAPLAHESHAHGTPITHARPLHGASLSSLSLSLSLSLC
eukprot:4588366-Prymnesium_polylepis.1